MYRTSLCLKSVWLEEMQQEIDRLKRAVSFPRSSESEDRSSVSSRVKRSQVLKDYFSKTVL